jgi:hypothetical protein
MNFIHDDVGDDAKNGDVDQWWCSWHWLHQKFPKEILMGSNEGEDMTLYKSMIFLLTTTH